MTNIKRHHRGLRGPRGETLSRTVQLRFTPAQHDRLQSMAEALEISVAQLIRLVVDAQLLDDRPPQWMLDQMAEQGYVE